MIYAPTPVESRNDIFEVRAYAGYVVAEVLIPGGRDAADRDGFRLLFRYISGANRPAQKLAMTAPVTTTAVESVEIPMTAPVSRIAETDGHRVQFVLPAGYTLASAPEPTDPRVQLREVPPMRVAVIRYSGTWSERNESRHLQRLRDAVAAAGLTVTGPPVLSRFNAPYVPPFFRRNEIWLPLAG
jgi:effector-binding domain-containing protein